MLKDLKAKDWVWIKKFRYYHHGMGAWIDASGVAAEVDICDDKHLEFSTFDDRRQQWARDYFVIPKNDPRDFECVKIKAPMTPGTCLGKEKVKSVHALAS